MNSRLSGYYPVGSQRRQFLGNAVLIDQVVDSLLQLQQVRWRCFPLRDLMGSATSDKDIAGEKESEASQTI
jgi:hypothetical protein